MVQVLHKRISRDLEGQLAPRVSAYSDLIPANAPAERRPWMEMMADAADQCRWELGARVAEQQPQWALETLGTVPDESRPGRVGEPRWVGGCVPGAGRPRRPGGRDRLGPACGVAREARRVARGAHRVAAVGARRRRGRHVRGPSPGPGLRAGAGVVPRWVGDELATTHQAAERVRADAELSGAWADVTEDAAQRQQLRDVAAEAAREAELLAEQVAELETWTLRGERGTRPPPRRERLRTVPARSSSRGESCSTTRGDGDRVRVADRARRRPGRR